MANSSKRVELHVYAHKINEIEINTYCAKEWDDFLILDIETPNMTQESWEMIQDAIGPIAEQMNKQVIVVPRNLKINFYGVEKIIDEPTNDV